MPGRLRILSRTTGTVTLALAIGGCHSGPASGPLMLTDGCYYVDKTPVFKIAGGTGRVLVPGPVRRFHVEASDGVEAKAVFTPPFLLDGSAHDIVTTGFDDGVTEFAYPMVAKTRVPTIRMNMAAFGEVDVVRGFSC